MHSKNLSPGPSAAATAPPKPVPLTPAERQFAAVLGAVLAERWLIAEQPRDTVPPTIAAGQVAPPPTEP